MSHPLSAVHQLNIPLNFIEKEWTLEHMLCTSHHHKRTFTLSDSANTLCPDTRKGNYQYLVHVCLFLTWRHHVSTEKRSYEDFHQNKSLAHALSCICISSTNHQPKHRMCHNLASHSSTTQHNTEK